MKLTPKLAITAIISSIVILIVPTVIGYMKNHFLLLSLTGAFFFILLLILVISSRSDPPPLRNLIGLALLSIALPIGLIIVKTDGFILVYINSFTRGIIIELPFITLFLLAIVLAFRSREKLGRIRF